MTPHRLADADIDLDGWTLTDELWAILDNPPAAHARVRFVEQDGPSPQYTQRQLVEQAADVAAGLVGLGIEAGAPVAVILPENQDFIRGFLAAVLVGMVPVPLFPPLGFGGLDAYVDHNAAILRACGARVLVTSNKLQHVMWSLISEVDTLQEVVCIEDLAGGSRQPISAPTRGPDDLCFLQYTSGSTAAPKGVMVDHRSLGANMFAIVHHGLQVRPDRDVAVSWLPLFHDMGLIGMTLVPLVTGTPANFIPSLDFVMYPSSWVDTISQRRGTITFAPNFAYALATRKVDADHIESLDLECLRVAGCGAEPIHHDTLRAFIDHFSPAGLRPEALLPAYGMAEATLAVSFVGVDEPIEAERVDPSAYQQQGLARQVGPGGLAGNRQPHEFVCCGQAFPDHHIRIVDDDGQQLGERHVGEIVFEGPSVTPGYFGTPDTGGHRLNDGTLYTGDLGYLADEKLFVTGRKKDLIIINGRNLDPQSVEWTAAEVDGVRKGNVVAFSVPAAHSEQLVVLAECRDNVDADRVTRDIKRAVSRKLYIKVSRVKLVDKATLPKTSSGKLQRAKARRQFMAGKSGNTTRAASRSVDLSAVGKHVGRSVLNRARHYVRRRLGRVAEMLRAMSLRG